MKLNTIRHVMLPAFRTARATFVSVFLMAAVILGLLAMHGAGNQHLPHSAAESSVAHVDEHSSTATAGAGSAVTPAQEIVAACGDECMSNMLGCMLMVMTCALMIALAVALIVANRPAVYKQLKDAGDRLREAVRDISTLFHRPDLNVLSISRT
jgi:hypothetical protein